MVGAGTPNAGGTESAASELLADAPRFASDEILTARLRKLVTDAGRHVLALPGAHGRWPASCWRWAWSRSTAAASVPRWLIESRLALQRRRHRRAHAAGRGRLVDDRRRRHGVLDHHRRAVAGGRPDGAAAAAQLHARPRQPGHARRLPRHVLLRADGAAQRPHAERGRVRAAPVADRRHPAGLRLRRHAGVFRRPHGGTHQRRHRDRAGQRRGAPARSGG